MVRGAMADWDLNTPRIEGTFATKEGWVPDYGSAASRCSGFGASTTVTRGSNPPVDFAPHEYGQGVNLEVPGSGSQEILVRSSGNTLAPADGASYPLVTRNNWQIGCLPALLNGAGQGFVALSPDGVRYRFDWMASRAQTPLRSSVAVLTRSDIYLMATLVTDRFGNRVRYTYDAGNPLNLQRIQASDGRLITLTYTGGRISAASDGTRTWLYVYSAQGDLQVVQQPDGSSWQFNLSPLVYQGALLLGEYADCDSMADAPVGTFVGTITHPSGAMGTFTSSFLTHGRTNVQRACTYAPGSDWTVGSVWPRSTSNQALTSKQITGPAMAPMIWIYDSGFNDPAGDWTCTSCPDRKTVTVTEPSGAVTRHTFGISWHVNEGQLLRVEEGWDRSAALKATAYSYRGAAGQAYPDRFGDSVFLASDYLATRNRPQELRVISQQGVDFIWQADASAAGFDRFARPVKVRNYSGVNLRTELTQFKDNLALWVLGQIARVTDADTGQEVESHTYADTTALRTASYSFGRLTHSFAYYPDGTLATLFDSAGQPTTFQDFMRGKPQRAVFADQSLASRVVNNLGNVASVTNEAVTTTSYTFDAMGRVNGIYYPVGDPVPYYPTMQRFEQFWGDEWGLPPGHWRQTITTGNAVMVRGFDAMWRVRLQLRYDDADPAGTSSYVETRYDAAGRKTFESYPTRTFVALDRALAGVSTTYDALHRVVQQTADSELGPLLTRTEYLAGFQRRVTNPRGQATQYTFQAFDTPTEDRITQIWAPETVAVRIDRDNFGKPLSINRWGAGGNVARSFVYDSFQRLCKTIEPESGATIQDYDPAGNIAWRASGLALPGGQCDQTSVPDPRKIGYSYDIRNRLRRTNYGDGSPAVDRSYTPDGLPLQVSAAGSTRSYAYYNRRQLMSESLGYAGRNYAFVYLPDAYGHNAAMNYPGGAMVQFSPNAWGEPTQVSGYASNVRYHPNGAVAGYTLANGRAHSVVLNTRGLPEQWQDSGVAYDRYRYDANGNVSFIDDWQLGLNRSMGYDGLDRLTQANGAWGSASYAYERAGQHPRQHRGWPHAHPSD